MLRPQETTEIIWTNSPHTLPWRKRRPDRPSETRSHHMSPPVSENENRSPQAVSPTALREQPMQDGPTLNHAERSTDRSNPPLPDRHTRIFFYTTPISASCGRRCIRRTYCAISVRRTWQKSRLCGMLADNHNSTPDTDLRDDNCADGDSLQIGECGRLSQGTTTVLRNSMKMMLTWEHMLACLFRIGQALLSAIQFGVVASSLRTANEAVRLPTYKTVRKKLCTPPSEDMLSRKLSSPSRTFPSPSRIEHTVYSADGDQHDPRSCARIVKPSEWAKMDVPTHPSIETSTKTQIKAVMTSWEVSPCNRLARCSSFTGDNMCTFPGRASYSRQWGSCRSSVRGLPPPLLGHRLMNWAGQYEGASAMGRRSFRFREGLEAYSAYALVLRQVIPSPNPGTWSVSSLPTASRPEVSR